MKRRNKSPCPIAFFLDSFGDKWTLLVLRDLLTWDKRHFRDFINPKERIATNILADRLKALLDAGLVTRRDDPDNRSMRLYTPTAKAVALLPVLEEMAKWALDHGPRMLARPVRMPAAQLQTGD